MSGLDTRRLYIDPQRCIGCRACVEACAECPSHGGTSMIHLDVVAPGVSVQTAPTVCMHCDDPACASVCPADAIQKDEHGVVHTAMTERCIGCSNCVLACPFGVPKYEARIDMMMKCDLCFDRTSRDLKPMCATVCPSGALFYGNEDEVIAQRGSLPTRSFRFGDEIVGTRNAYVATGQGETFSIAPTDGSAATSVADRCLEEVLL